MLVNQTHRLGLTRRKDLQEVQLARTRSEWTFINWLPSGRSACLIGAPRVLEVPGRCGASEADQVDHPNPAREGDSCRPCVTETCKSMSPMVMRGN
ncbi:unnamed protein product [Prunus armeniaca]